MSSFVAAKFLNTTPRCTHFIGKQTTLTVELVQEKRWDVTNYLDFALPHFEPVHLNLFLLISSSSKMSRPNGLLPAKQKVGRAGPQGTATVGQLPAEGCSTLTSRLDLLRPDAGCAGSHGACSGEHGPPGQSQSPRGWFS